MSKKDKGIYFHTRGGQTQLPVGEYRLKRGTLSYNDRGSQEWQTSFADGPAFAVKADQTTAITLGKPTLGIRAVDYRKRYSRNHVPGTRFPRSTRIYLTRDLSGQNDEAHGPITLFTYASGAPEHDGFPEDDVLIAEILDLPKPKGRGGRTILRRNQIRPHLTIQDPKGKQIVAKDLEYG